MNLCFNPCYVGSKMERLWNSFVQMRVRCFNPCYVGSKMERHGKNPACDNLGGFQSLLCWK